MHTAAAASWRVVPQASRHTTRPTGPRCHVLSLFLDQLSASCLNFKKACLVIVKVTDFELS